MGSIYGEANASSANVDFSFELALASARDLWALADAVETAKSELTTAQAAAIVDWTGPKHDTFVEHRTTDGSNAQSVANGLRSLARDFAQKWAQARGQQDRINHARWAQHEKDNENFFESAWHWVAGEKDYGDPPENPPTPTSDAFRATRDPIHPEFE